jgi:uncharacterized protein YgbK (DUF1537 family)
MEGHAAVLAGSCSRATLGQIGLARDHAPTLELDALATPDAAALAGQALDWAAGKLGDAPVVIAASAPPDRVAACKAKLGREAAGALVEDAMAGVAKGWWRAACGAWWWRGARPPAPCRAARRALAPHRAGDRPGVPWTYAEPAGLHLALKSGNSAGATSS